LTEFKNKHDLNNTISPVFDINSLILFHQTIRGIIGKVNELTIAPAPVELTIAPAPVELTQYVQKNTI
jgi:hypothetical protein